MSLLKITAAFALALTPVFVVPLMVHGPDFWVSAAAPTEEPVKADELIVLRAENNLLRQQALKRDAELAAERQRGLAETLRREIGAAAVAAGLDPDGYVLDIDKRQWVPKPAPSVPMPAAPPAAKP